MDARAVSPQTGLRNPNEGFGRSPGLRSFQGGPLVGGAGTAWPQPTAAPPPPWAGYRPGASDAARLDEAGESRVFLIDDHVGLREPLAALLDDVPGLSVSGQASSISDTRRLVDAGIAADVIVVDLNLPDGSGVDLIRELRTARPRGAILVLTASCSTRDQALAVQAGAQGVLLKSAPIASIIEAVRRLGAGLPVFPPAQIVEMLRLANEERERAEEAKALLDRLTPREREVLSALAEGMSDKDIALRLHVSNKTVRVHMANILEKLGLESRLQALIFAVRHGLVDIS